MLQNGLFEISYPMPLEAGGGTETLLAVCRGGALTASDPHGGVYLGQITLAASFATKAALSLNGALPEGEACERHCEPIQPAPAAVEIHGVVDPSAERQTAVLVVDGEPLEVEIAYVGALPG